MTPKSDTPRRVALFAGSFNPFTLGHWTIVQRALDMFDAVVVGVGYNASKPRPDDLSERVEAIRRAVATLGPRVSVESFGGLAVEAARRFGARFMVRGVRSVADFEYERDMADINRRIGGIETVVLFTLPELAAVSSSVVRELSSYGVDVSGFLPPRH